MCEVSPLIVYRWSMIIFFIYYCTHHTVLLHQPSGYRLLVHSVQIMENLTNIAHDLRILDHLLTVSLIFTLIVDFSLMHHKAKNAHFGLCWPYLSWNLLHIWCTYVSLCPLSDSIIKSTDWHNAKVWETKKRLSKVVIWMVIFLNFS